MDNSGLLSAEDNLFGRMALHNQLVTPEQIAECARALFVEHVAGLPRRTLGEILVAQGYLSPEVAKSIAGAVHRKLGPGAEADPPGPAPTPGPPAARRPAPARPPAPPARAKSGDSRVTVRTEAGAGPQGKRIWVEAPEGGDAAAVKVGCIYLYPNDAPELAAACRELLALDRSTLQIDMRGVDYVPSVIFGEIARAGLEAAAQKRQLTLLAKTKVAAVADMIVGRIVNVVAAP